ncbi:MAG TPA: hypothetical protein PKM41_11325 [Deltaproteobacteria bacterium]|nr:hypothetical protein [Deltaproteobacteria bacterium]HOI08430.1 hypothetical protein [Deltaproteobacteria bacterium]
MNARHIALVFFVCATALTAGCRFSNEAMLADRQGRIFYGTVSFDAEKKFGTITFPRSPYGELKGRLTLVPTDEKNPVIQLDSIPLKAYSGRATLLNEGQPSLECQITAEFLTEGAGDMKMNGCGACTDRNGTPYDISFN